MKTNKRRGKMTLIFIAFVSCAIILGIFMVNRYEKMEKGVPSTPVPQQTGALSITLLFSAPDGSGLVREGRNIDSCIDTEECISAVIDELARGPLGDLEPTVPPNTVVREVRIENDQAVIDFEEGFAEGLPEGSSAEMTAVYSIVDSVALNFPAIRGVQFLVNGNPVETLKGHVDLRRPISPDFTLEKQIKQ